MTCPRCTTTPHDGGPIPPAFAGRIVRVTCRDGGADVGLAEVFRWRWAGLEPLNGDVMAVRIEPGFLAGRAAA